LSIQVKVSKGFHRGQQCSGVFKLVKPFQDNGNGGWITVEDINGLIPWAQTNAPRIKLSKGDFTLMDAAGEELGEHVVIEGAAGGVSTSVDYEQMFMQTESEDEAMERIAETFLMLDKIVDACARSVVRGLVVTGPPGIGKSFGVEKQLEAANMFRTMAGQDPRYEVVSGGVSAIGLYQKLYYNRSTSQVLVFDDCDGILFEEESLNLLKAALNSGDKRRICWNKESRVLQVEDIPDQFDFEASIVFLSNIDFERTISKGSRIAAHLEAIMSRCHYLDLEIGSTRDKLLRIKQIVRDGMLTSYNFAPAEEQAVLDFVFDNSEYLRELSLRMVKKIADFVKADPKGWHEMAEATCLQREAKFKRLMAKKQREAEKRGVMLQAA
jgi:hypothetical protein